MLSGRLAKRGLEFRTLLVVIAEISSNEFQLNSILLQYSVLSSSPYFVSIKDLFSPISNRIITILQT